MITMASIFISAAQGDKVSTLKRNPRFREVSRDASYVNANKTAGFSDHERNLSI